MRHIAPRKRTTCGFDFSAVRKGRVPGGVCTLIVRLFAPHISTSTSTRLSPSSNPSPPKYYRNPHTRRAMAATYVSTRNGLPTQAISPTKLAVNGHSSNHTADRLQIVNNEKQFTYVSMQSLCYRLLMSFLQTRLQRPDFCLGST